MDTWSDRQLTMMEVCIIIFNNLTSSQFTTKIDIHNKINRKPRRHVVTIFQKQSNYKQLTFNQIQAGGNGKVKEFFRKHGVPDGVGIKEKYNTRAAQLFKEKVVAQVDVSEPIIY